MCVCVRACVCVCVRVCVCACSTTKETNLMWVVAVLSSLQLVVPTQSCVCEGGSSTPYHQLYGAQATPPLVLLHAPTVVTMSFGTHNITFHRNVCEPN